MSMYTGGDQCSEVELGSSPVSAGSIVPDFVVSSVPDPVWKRTVRIDFLSVPSLLTECLNCSHLFFINNCIVY